MYMYLREQACSFPAHPSPQGRTLLPKDTPLSPRTHPSPRGCTPLPEDAPLSPRTHPSPQGRTPLPSHFIMCPPLSERTMWTQSLHTSSRAHQPPLRRRRISTCPSSPCPRLNTYRAHTFPGSIRHHGHPGTHVSQCTQHTHSSPCPQVHTTLPTSPCLHRDHVLLSSHIASG